MLSAKCGPATTLHMISKAKGRNSPATSASGSTRNGAASSAGATTLQLSGWPRISAAANIAPQRDPNRGGAPRWPASARLHNVSQTASSRTSPWPRMNTRGRASAAMAPQLSGWLCVRSSITPRPSVVAVSAISPRPSRLPLLSAPRLLSSDMPPNSTPGTTSSSAVPAASNALCR